MNVISVTSCLNGLSLLKQTTFLARINNQLLLRYLSNKSSVPKESNRDLDHNEVDDSQQILRGPRHTPSDLDKWFLTWTGYFKRSEDIPKTVTRSMMDKARNKARIKFSNWAMGLGLVGCFGFALLGRQAAERGDTVHKMNVDWHKEINKEHRETTNR